MPDQADSYEDTHDDDAESELEELVFDGIYLFSGTQLRQVEKRTRQLEQDRRRRAGGANALAPTTVPQAFPIYRGRDDRRYIVVIHDSIAKPLPIKVRNRFDPKQPSLGGFIDEQEITRLQKSTRNLLSAVGVMQEQVGQIASEITTSPTEQQADVPGPGQEGSSSLADDLTQAMRAHLEGLAGEGLASLMTGDGLDALGGVPPLEGLAGLGVQKALGYGVSELFSMWSVDADSSAATQLSKMFMQQAAERLQNEIQARLLKKGSSTNAESIRAFFNGAKPSKPLMAVAKSADPTSHGGVLVSGAARTKITGLPPIRTLDTHVCPLCDGSTPHVGGPVREGNPTIRIEGKLLARAGHLAICTGVGAQTQLAPAPSGVYIGDVTCAVLPPPNAEVPTPDASTAGAGSNAASESSTAGPEAEQATSHEEESQATKDDDKNDEAGKPTPDGFTEDGRVDPEAPVTDEFLKQAIENGLKDLPEAERNRIATELKGKWRDVLALEQSMDRATTPAERMRLLDQWGKKMSELRGVSGLERRWHDISAALGRAVDGTVDMGRNVKVPIGPVGSAFDLFKLPSTGEIARIAESDPRAAWRETGAKALQFGVGMISLPLRFSPLGISVGVGIDHIAGSAGARLADLSYDWAEDVANRMHAEGYVRHPLRRPRGRR